MSEKPVPYRADFDQARSIQAIQAPKAPFVLYHYTTRHGLLGMLNTGKLHASHILYLNDHQEFRYAESLAEEPIRERAESTSPYQDIYRAFADRRQTIALRYEIRTVFVFSMSQNSDQLSQWRAYSQPSDGYCVGFRIPELLTTVGKSFHIVQCNYDEMQQENLIRTLFDDTEADFERNLAAGVPRENAIVGAVAFLLLGLSSLAPALKHPAFSEEKEWRLVCWKSMGDAEYRIARSMLVPYLPVPFITTNNFLPITDIIIGPTPHPDLDAFALGSLLAKHNATEVAVTPSVIPYRTW
jgi:hypothetical protein